MRTYCKEFSTPLATPGLQGLASSRKRVKVPAQVRLAGCEITRRPDDAHANTGEAGKQPHTEQDLSKRNFLLAVSASWSLSSCPATSAAGHSKSVQGHLQPQKRLRLTQMNATILRYRFQKVKNAVPLSIRGVAEIDLELFASRVALPTGWALNEPQSSPPGIGPTATRRILAWFEESNPATYVTATVTNVGADYTSLGSFGTAEQFGSSLVASMDQSFLRRTPFGKRAQNMQEARLISARDEGNMFNLEYTIKRNEDDERHLLSIVAIGYNGRYTRLYTITGQASETAFPKDKAVLQQILGSFQAPNPRL